ncbi:MAG: tetratricopeptide repeat protein [Mesorhizobium sp.]|uniref:LuxR C-terminal-related transcriptional regulator n=2 Tax=Mesorhizobium TaxID=68287 RepID=UPI000F7525D9|nr:MULTISPECIES: LuxR C-terminal-related transcriptional regulator [unclassified Mesorhizobium]RVD71725.1 tetratricopeptide repeat protein [Mesorhizobium sp. M4A.F.Ca.ET.029.04.2.1]AZO47818.1 tetratricopeptide repeat protein [Mesorhizobium sp. M4B.F.Ca.ET.058.02.1.1]RVC44942.1 tetratricopeptide repeat protein [Mesorhizobium sp. M4A.F.Ca.ET.090.04.2.1]RWC52111.1 MAG: tetratricopeptide repeat protein [Mesorhizobium sp.]RWD03230.1 MAG: tetratricopeptide repeat protein [Mesorhizobium sp.]
MNHNATAATSSASSPALSERERAVAEKFAAGLTYRQIGEALFIAPSTVRTHLAAIYEKLGVRNKVALAAHLNGIASLPPDKPSALPGASPVLAIFPIECLSDEERWRRFANGLSSDITVDLARYAGLPVIAFHTMKALGSKPADFAADGKALGAAYIVSGQLRADDRRVRLTMELADAGSGLSLWSERYDRPVEDIFALQDSLTESVINVLAGCFGTIATIGRNAVRRKPPASLRAYDLYLLGVEQHNTFSRAGNAEAIRLFSRALELDPTLVRAWTELAYAYSIEAGNCFGRDPRASIEKWRAAVENAIRLDPFDSSACNCFGDLMGCLGDLDAAERAYKRAYECGPNHADTLALLAGSKALVAGDPAEAIPLIERAMRLNPLAPPWYFGMQGRVLFCAGRHREAIAALRRSTPDSPNVLMFLALSHAASGEGAEAAGFVARLAAEFPDFSVEGFISGYPVTNPEAVRAIRDAAKLAGLG